MKTMKFGGGCLKDAEGLRRVVNTIKSDRDRVSVVVSAVSGVTDLLLRGIAEVQLDQSSGGRTIGACRDIHLRLLEQTVSNESLRRETERSLGEQIGKAERILTGVGLSGEMTVVLRNLVLSLGERLSARLVAAALKSEGVEARAYDADAIGLLTDGNLENATAELCVFRKNIAQHLPDLHNGGFVPVITGFFGVTPGGRVSLFGRNGSDYSAAVVANAVGANVLEIWKDVDGFMTADPKLIPQARKIDRLSFYEAAELSYFGAKILHPRTLEPLGGRNVAVRIRSLLDPCGSGTEIRPSACEDEEVVKSVTSDDAIAVLRIHGPGVGYKPGVIGHIGRRLAGRSVNIHAIITAQTCINLLLDKSDARESLDALRDVEPGVINRLDLETDIVLIAVVGEGLLQRKGVAARIFSAVSQAGVNVEMISTGASEAAAYFIVRRLDGEKAVKALHGEFFET